MINGSMSVSGALSSKFVIKLGLVWIWILQEIIVRLIALNLIENLFLNLTKGSITVFVLFFLQIFITDLSE